MSGFLEIVDRARSLLADRGRVSLRGLRREFSLDEETLEDLEAELIEQGMARRDENSLVFTGESGSRGPTPPDQGPSDTQPAAPRVEIAVEPDSAPMPRETGERRQLTVMFCDLVGSTELSMRLDPEELSEVLHAYREVCIAATKQFDGHIAQYLGDGVLVYFGYPRAHEDDAGRAVRAGLEIQRLLGARPDAGRIIARIGIHSGLVVVGEDAMALGPTTNVAARIESAASPGSVVISGDTLSLCRRAFVTTSLGEFELKGLDAPLELHQVEQSLGMRAAGVTHAERPMVGRDREVGLLLDRWEEVQDGRGQVVLVSGEAGMGKSRLLQALREEVSDTPHIWQEMRCSPFTSGSAFQPLIDLFRAGSDSAPSDPAEDAGQALVRELEGLDGLPLDQVLPFVLALLSLPPSDRYPLPQTSAEEQRRRTLSAFARLNLAQSERTPIVLVVEDLHWVDRSTLEYLGRIVEQAPTVRVLLVATFRPEFDPPWQQSHVSSVNLARLSRRVTRELIRNAAGARLPEPVLVELETRSDGVPLFVEELVSGVVSSDVVVEQEDGFQLSGSIRDLGIPATLQDSLMARLDRLSASKQVAQEASNLGREFSYALIEAVSDLDTPSLRTALGQLEGAEIVHRRGSPPDAHYTFKHALIQDTAYESQLLSTRRAMHEKVVHALEERFPERVEAEPELMAFHCAAAGDADGAVGHYQRAAELAVSRVANEEASEQYTRALEALEALPEDDARKQREIALRLEHGTVLMTLHGYQAPQVTRTFGRVEALADSIGEGPQQLPALIGLAQFSNARGESLANIRWAESIMRIAEPLGVPELMLLGHFLMGGVEILTGSQSKAEDRLARAVAILETANFPPPANAYVQDLPASLHAVHAIALICCGRPEAASRSIEAMHARFDEIDHDYSRVALLSTITVAWFIGIDPAETRSAAQASLALAEGRGFHTHEASAKIFGGWARACYGETEEGIRDIDAGLELAATAGSAVVTSLYYVAAAETYRLANQPDRAAELLDHAQDLGERGGEIGPLSEVALSRALLLLERGGRTDEVIRGLRDADALAERSGTLPVNLVAGTHLVRLASNTQDESEARARLAECYARLTEGFERAHVREAKAVLDDGAT